MSFIGPTTILNIRTSSQKCFKIFITEQVGGFWVATLLYSKDEKIHTRHFSGKTKVESYKKTSEWVLNDLDNRAVIDRLEIN
jgi:hypothetical protein